MLKQSLKLRAGPCRNGACKNDDSSAGDDEALDGAEELNEPAEGSCTALYQCRMSR